MKEITTGMQSPDSFVPYRPATPAPISILIVDDDQDDYLHLREILCEFGQSYFQIDWAKNFEEGRTALTTHSYDVCLLDYQLGGHTGLDLLHELSTHHETITAIIMVAGIENIDIDQQAMKAGAMDYIVKGELNPALARRAIRHALNHRLTQLALKEYAQELERKNRELAVARDDALSAIRLKAAFLSNMSHETRTPLTGIIGLIRLLQDTALTSDQQEALQTIEDCTNTLLGMINNILDFSRMEEGQLEFQHIGFDIRTTLDTIVAHFTPHAQRKNLDLITHIHANVPNTIQGDPHRFRQILNNLIANAIKFSNKGEIEVRVTAQWQTTTNVMIQISVMDCGVGMSDEEQQHLYEAFTQGDGSPKRKYPGAGLGLAVTKLLTEAMGGTIGVESTVGKGSRFWVTIPFDHSPETIPQSTTAAIDFRDLRVALFCADSAIQAFVEHCCWQWGVSLVSWSTAEHGLGMLRDSGSPDTPWNVIILDDSLPDMGAFPLVEYLKADPSLSHIPLILVTEGKPGEGKTAQEVGVTAYLTKPFQAWHIQDCLRCIAQSITTDRPSPHLATTLMTKHSLLDARSKDKTRILLIEDNAVSQTVLIRALEKLGYRVDVVSSAREAADAIRSHRYHLVLLDEWVSEFDQGATATLEEHLKSSAIPVVVMTNSLNRDNETCSMKQPVVFTLPKPIKLEDLAEVVTHWISQNNAPQDDSPVFATVSKGMD